MDRCEPLKEYSEFIGNGILKYFLTNNRNEVRSMSLFEFDAEEHEKAIKQIAYEEGELDVAARGEQVGRIKMLYELGNTIPEIAVKLNISEESVKDIIKA
jgi:predicted transposase YdaD